MPLPNLLLITDRNRFDGDDFFVRIEAALAGGVNAILVREKQMDSARLLAFCSRLKKLTRASDAQLIVHTQADVANAVDAEGVHVTAKEINNIPAMRRWLATTDHGSRMTISASCHNANELSNAAIAGADFALLSPVFPTASHPDAPHLGVRSFGKLAKGSPLPVIALGGITSANRSKIADYPVAVISAILAADDPEKTACRMWGST